MIRRCLQNILCDAWQQSIILDYENQRINSESSLQASYWSQLNSRLPAKSWRIFVEPTFKVGANNKTVRPDLVISNSREIVSVIELKYLPNAQPKSEKDLNTLRLIAQNKHRLCLTNHRFRGDKTKCKSLGFSDKTLFVWACVHKLDLKSGSLKNSASYGQGTKSLKDSYLELHVETTHETSPNLFKKNY